MGFTQVKVQMKSGLQKQVVSLYRNPLRVTRLQKSSLSSFFPHENSLKGIQKNPLKLEQKTFKPLNMKWELERRNWNSSRAHQNKKNILLKLEFLSHISINK